VIDGLLEWEPNLHFVDRLARDTVSSLSGKGQDIPEIATWHCFTEKLKVAGQNRENAVNAQV
jgi:hypothetical protein